MIKLKRCAKAGCSVLGVGPRAQKLYPLEDRLWCEAHWREHLSWAVERPNVVLNIERLVSLDAEVFKIWKHGHRAKSAAPPSWDAILHEWSGMAGEALVVGDRRTFTHYFARAVWAWALREAANAAP